MPSWYLAGNERFRGAVPAAAAPPLLDTLSASAIVAYSTRKLRSAYSGKPIQVTTGAGGHAAQDVAFTAGGDLDESAGPNGLANIITGTHDGAINLYYDQSTAGTNGTGGVPSGALPLVNAGVTYKRNNHPCAFMLNAVGWGNDGFFNQAALNYQGGAAVPQPLTMAFCFQLSNLAATAHLADGGSGARILAGFTGSATNYQIFAGGSVVTGGTPDITAVHTAFWVFNGASSHIYIDGVDISGIVGTDIGANQLFNGGTEVLNPSNAWVCEHLVFASILSGPGAGSDMDKIRASWQSYWGAA